MKELSIEQKAKAYDEALERMKSWVKGEYPECFTEAQKAAEFIFPELKESEDERIRKDIIRVLKGEISFTSEKENEKYITWLEKQGTSYTKKDVDDAYLEGISVAKNEMEKQYEADYQIRKDIATFIFNYRGVLKDRAKWMDYLGIKVSFVEKQGEKPQGKSAFEAAKEEKIDTQNCVNPTNNPESKFYEEDWIAIDEDDNPCQIINIDNKENYIVQYCNDEETHVLSKNFCESHFHLWNIQDAKDGDVLACGEEILLFKSYSVQGRISLYCWYNGQTNNFHNKEVVYILLTTRNKVCPATKEQRDLLFQKMTEVGYEWDAEKKELKKIKMTDLFEDYIEQKPVMWTEIPEIKELNTE